MAKLDPIELMKRKAVSEKLLLGRGAHLPQLFKLGQRIEAPVHRNFSPRATQLGQEDHSAVS